MRHAVCLDLNSRDIPCFGFCRELRPFGFYKSPYFRPYIRYVVDQLIADADNFLLNRSLL